MFDLQDEAALKQGSYMWAQGAGWEGEKSLSRKAIYFASSILFSPTVIEDTCVSWVLFLCAYDINLLPRKWLWSHQFSIMILLKDQEKERWAVSLKPYCNTWVSLIISNVWVVICKRLTRFGGLKKRLTFWKILCIGRYLPFCWFGWLEQINNDLK